MKSILTVSMNPTLQKTLVFSRLEPDTVNRCTGHSLDTAGKGINVSRVLTQLGKNCVHLTPLGGSLRPLFLELCTRDGLNIEWAESFSPIRFCYTLINREDKTVTELVEEGEKAEEHTGERLLLAFEKLLPKVSSVVISGSMAAGFSAALISEMVAQARAKALRVILDIRGRDLLECLPLKPDIIKPNLVEFVSTFCPELLTGNKIIMDEAELRDRIALRCEELFNEYGVQIILTRGSKPIWYAEDGELLEFAVDIIEPVNTTGSGDAFTAGLAAGLEDGKSLREAAAEGARCGKLNAGLLRPGVIR